MNDAALLDSLHAALRRPVPSMLTLPRTISLWPTSWLISPRNFASLMPPR